MENVAGITVKKTRKSHGDRRKKDGAAREFHLYNGRDYIGRVMLNEKARKAKAFDSQGNAVGEFSGFDAAAAAVWQSMPPPIRKSA